jgi:hypothetical protein
MKEYVAWYFIGCLLCSTNKPNNRKQGLYYPLPIPTQPYERISMDFVGGLPTTSKGHENMFMVVHRFNKM